jgi:nucleoid DNA-binding protein
MNKTDIVKDLAKASGTIEGLESVKLTQDQASVIFNEVVNIITRGLKDDEIVQITGFGTFKSKYVPARKSKNPRTGEECMVASRNQVSFSSGSKLKAAVNEG